MLSLWHGVLIVIGVGIWLGLVYASWLSRADERAYWDDFMRRRRGPPC